MEPTENKQNNSTKKPEAEKGNPLPKMPLTPQQRQTAMLQDDDFDFLAESKEATLQKRTPVANMLLATISAFLFLALIWAYFSLIDEVTHATGKVIPASQIQVIQNLEGGILSEVLVNQGDDVKKGQVLLRIDDTRFASSYREQYTQYLALLASVARLEAETKGLDTITYPKELQDYPDIVADENELYATRLNALNNSLTILQASYNLAKEEYDLAQPLVAQGVMSRIEVLRLERQVNDIRGEIEQRRNEYQEEAQTELVKQNAQLEALKEVLLSQQDRVSRTTVKSPVDGTVNEIHINTVGGVIQPGMDIMEIVPKEDYLLVQAKINPKDIAFIRIGQNAKVKFSAYDFSIYGGLDGTVQYIGADTIVEEEKNETYYEVFVKTEKNYLGTEENPLPIKIGMVTTVDIITGRKSVLDYLLKPLIKAKQNALRER